MYEMKKQLRWSALKAGVAITLALLTLFAVVMYAGTIKQLFTPSFELRARFEDVKGLRKGAPVWLFGTEVGSVKNIQLNPEYGTIITLSVNKSAEPFIRSNSEAEILTMGLLGETYVELMPGSPRAESIRPGEVIKGKTPAEFTEVVEASANTIEKVAELIDKLEIVITSMTEGRGSLAKFINDPTLYNTLEKSAAVLHSTLEQIEKSRGTLRLLLEDPSLYRQLAATASSLEVWSRNLRKSSGTLNKLIENPELYDNLSESAKNLDSILTNINKGKGMAGALVHDERLVGEVKETLLEIRGLAEEMKILTKDIKEHPEKYFKFNLF
jgi:phospholipid/cholesterol/gamma-HCH transport system substrate-binding protein